MKICSICKLEKIESEFNKRKVAKDGLSSACRVCTRKQFKRHYSKNRDSIKAKALMVKERVKKENAIKLMELKNKPCTDCGQTFPHYVMDFDHLGNKKHSISEMRQGFVWEKILEEISKCELVCANCHRIRTHKRRAEAK